MLFKIISMVCFTIVAISSLIMGVVYTTRKAFMPYHKVAIGKEWGDLEEGVKTIILALMKFGGAGFLTTGVISLGAMCIFWDQWIAFIFISIASFIFCLAGLLITSWVRRETGASPPAVGPIINVVVVPVGVIFYVLSIV